MTEWIECSWTVYVNNPGAELPIQLGVRPDLPQFTVTELDPSFLQQAYTILQGKTAFEVAARHSSPDAIEDRPRRIAAAVVVANELTVHVYEYPDTMCRSFAAMDEPRVADVARRWPTLLWPSLHPDDTEPDFGTPQQGRESVLRQLANLARVALASGRKLMTRIEWRRCSQDPETGQIHRNEGTKH